jgi:hypothetical protein
MSQTYCFRVLAGAGIVALGALWPVVTPAQSPYGQPPAPPASIQGQGQGSPSPQNPVCARLETQLASVERGGGDPSRQTNIRRNEDNVNQLQSNLDRLTTQSHRLGCQSAGIFSIFTPQPAQCSSLGSQIDQARTALDRAMNELQRSQIPGGNDLESQRQSVIAALAQNNCGPQYRAAAAAPQRGVFETIFGGANTQYNGVDVSRGGTFRTLCVRTCDGYYYPISFATSPSHFADDEQTCRNTCPAAEVALYSHRTNEDVRSAATVQGRRYIDLPNAFKYRQTFDPTCSCRRPGQSWADALSQTPDRTLVRGDIIVDEKGKQSTPQVPSAATAPQPLPPQPAPSYNPTQRYGSPSMLTPR